MEDSKDQKFVQVLNTKFQDLVTKEDLAIMDLATEANLAIMSLATKADLASGRLKMDVPTDDCSGLNNKDCCTFLDEISLKNLQTLYKKLTFYKHYKNPQ